MNADIKFGTDGWRAVIAKDFTFDNVKRVINAISLYVLENYDNKPVLIGYDTRFMADKFAMYASEILNQNGIDTLLVDDFCPTPAIAYCAQKYNSAGAIMFTASHNPPEYLGIKYIPDYAGPATKEITDKIISFIDKPVEIPAQQGENKMFSPKEDYFSKLKEIIDFEKIKSANLNIIYDPLFATGRGYFDGILKKNDINLKVINDYQDPLYGGNMPEPKLPYIKELQIEVKKSENAVGFSNDGDADRYGVIDEKGKFITPNEVMALLLEHLIKNKKMTGALVKTVAGSLMLDIIAKKYDVPVIETAVGFKWVGEAMRQNDVLIGGEESGGLSIKNHIPEKDGILANLLIIEMIAYENKPLFKLVENLKKQVGVEFINTRTDLPIEGLNSKEVIAKIEEKFVNNKIFKAVKTDKKDGLKIYLSDDKTWILIRPSGTEPLLRIYFESDNNQKVERLNHFIREIIS